MLANSTKLKGRLSTFNRLISTSINRKFSTSFINMVGQKIDGTAIAKLVKSEKYSKT